MTIDTTRPEKKLITPDIYYGLICKCGATILAKDKSYKCPSCGNNADYVGELETVAKRISDKWKSTT